MKVVRHEGVQEANGDWATVTLPQPRGNRYKRSLLNTMLN